MPFCPLVEVCPKPNQLTDGILVGGTQFLESIGHVQQSFLAAVFTKHQPVDREPIGPPRHFQNDVVEESLASVGSLEDDAEGVILARVEIDMDALVGIKVPADHPRVAGRDADDLVAIPEFDGVIQGSLQPLNEALAELNGEARGDEVLGRRAEGVEANDSNGIVDGMVGPPVYVIGDAALQGVFIDAVSLAAAAEVALPWCHVWRIPTGLRDKTFNWRILFTVALLSRIKTFRAPVHRKGYVCTPNELCVVISDVPPPDVTDRFGAGGGDNE